MNRSPDSPSHSSCGGNRVRRRVPVSQWCQCEKGSGRVIEWRMQRKKLRQMLLVARGPRWSEESFGEVVAKLPANIPLLETFSKIYEFGTRPVRPNMIKRTRVQ